MIGGGGREKLVLQFLSEIHILELLTFSLSLTDISIAIPLPGRTANGFAYKEGKCSFITN